MKQTVLAKNSKGIKAVRVDYKQRSAVKVQALDGSTIRTYRMNNIADYKHPMMSWNNLLMCGGWASDNLDGIKAVNRGSKPICTVIVRTKDNDTKQMEAEADKLGLKQKGYGFMVLLEPWHLWNGEWNWVLAAVPEDTTLNDLYDLDEIREAYEAQGIVFLDEDWRRTENFAKMQLVELVSGYEIMSPTDYMELVTTGMLFGYPIESTASIIFES